MPTEAENIQYLYLVLTNDGHPNIDWEKVGTALSLSKGAVNKRWSRLKQAMDKNDFPGGSTYQFLWLCVKHNNRDKNWAEIADKCNTTSDAASKRYSRMKKAFEDGNTAPGSPSPSTTTTITKKKKEKNETPASDSTPSKRKRAPPKKKNVPVEEAKFTPDPEAGDDEEDVDVDVKSKRARTSKPKPKSKAKAAVKKEEEEEDDDDDELSTPTPKPDIEDEDAFFDAVEDVYGDERVESWVRGSG